MAPNTAERRSDDPGLSEQIDLLDGQLSALVADLEPDRILGSEAAGLYASFARLERLVVAAKCLLARRIAASGHWESEGYRSPAGLLATLEGVSAGQARKTLETGQRLESLPSTEEALRSGTLSGPKVTEIAQAATLDPDAEDALLAGAATDPLHVVKQRCQRPGSTSAARDPMATFARISAGRSFASWTDAEGAFCFQGRDTADRGARCWPASSRWPTDWGATPRRGRGRTRRAPGPSPRPPGPPCGPTPCSCCAPGTRGVPHRCHPRTGWTAARPAGTGHGR